MGRISITADTLEELKEILEELLGGESISPKPQASKRGRPKKKAPKGQDAALGKKESNEPKNLADCLELKKKEKKRIAEELAPQPAPIITNYEDAEPKGDVTKDFVKEKLSEFNVRMGMQKTRKLLNEFGANKLSELKPDHYGSFVIRVQELFQEAEGE